MRIIVNLSLLAIISFFSFAAYSKNPISVIRDEETERFLKDVTKPILSAAGLDFGSVEIIIVNDKSINAFVSSGQKIFIHTGLITECPDVSCLVGVLAHESGHIKGGHIIRKDENYEDANLSTIAGYILGLGSVLAGAPPEAGIALSSAGQNVAVRQVMKSSRSYENSADTVALDVMKKIGISPRGLVAILEKLKQKQGISGDIYDKYLLTHPISQERIGYIKAFIRQNPEVDKPLPKVLNERFNMIKAKIFGFLYDPQVVDDTYQSNDTKEALYAKAISLHREARFDESDKLLNKLISIEPSNPFFKELKAQFLFERGKISESVKKYKEVLNLLGTSNLVRLKLAEALMGLNNSVKIKEAMGQLKAILATEPDNVGAIHKLGIAYGKLGNLEESYIYLAESAVISKNLENAKFYLAKAGQLVDKSSDNYSRVKALKEEAKKLVGK